MRKFEAVGIPVHQAEDDADVLIVKTALKCQQQGKTAVVVGNDTDLLAILIARGQLGNLFMLHPGTSKTPGKLSLNEIQEHIGYMKNAVLFSHAISGGDKTSAIFGKGEKRPSSCYKTMRIFDVK